MRPPAASSLLLFKELVGSGDHPVGFVLRAIIGELDEHFLVLVAVDHGRLRVIPIVPVEPNSDDSLDADVSAEDLCGK